MKTKIFGEHDAGTIGQIETCVAAGGERAVLCADGHKGYAQPIGGVVAYRDKISLSGVGFDIACGNLAILTDAKLTVEGLVEYVHGLCEELKAREEKNIALPSPELRTAWQHVLALGKYADSADGRSSFVTLAGKVRHAFNFLTRHGLLKRDGSAVRQTWLARPSFRIHVRELASHEAFAIISNAAQEAAHG